MPSEDIEVYGFWNLDAYTISYNLDGGVVSTPNPTTYNVEEETIILFTPTKTGYTFMGWYDNALYEGETINWIQSGSVGNKSLYSKWAINQYTLSFEENGGTAVIDIKQDYNTTVVAPANPTRDGYTFGGWYRDSQFNNPYTFSTIDAENIKVYAKWNPKAYTITYVLNNENNNLIIPGLAGSSLSLMIPTREGYTFSGWYLEEDFQNSYEEDTFPINNIILYAKWEQNT
jgi:uncharacterized repeat protein (TIGR02543 family)